MTIRTIAVWLMLFASAMAVDQKVVVVVDDSGSMADWMRSDRVRKIDAAKQALNVVLEKLPDGSKLGVLALNAGWLMPLQDLDRGKLQNSIQQLKARGSTPLGARMSEACDELLKLRTKEIYGDYRLLVVSDGEAGDQALLNHVLPDIMSRGFAVDVVGVDMVSDHSLATRVHNYRRADDPGALEEAIATSLAESNSDDAVGGESDFELLAGLPDDVAPFVISSLTVANNAPISGEGFEADDYFPQSSFGGGGNSGGGSGGGMIGGVVCMFVLFFFVATVSSLFKAITRRGR